MEYLSTKEIAQKWGISTTRIVVLAKAGRIPGARQMGTNWLIPANAPKPADARKKQKIKERFLFPLFIFQNHTDPDFRALLTSEEEELLEIQILMETLQCEESYSRLLMLLEHKLPIHLEIGVVYLLCYASFATKRCKEFRKYFLKLQLLFREDFPHKLEMDALHIDLISMGDGILAMSKNFHIDASHTYHPSARPFLTCISVYTSITDSFAQESPLNPTIFQLICSEFEERHLVVATSLIYVYTAMLFKFRKEEEQAKFYLKKALQLAVKFQYFSAIFMNYLWLVDLFDAVLPDFPFNEREQINRYCQQIRECWETLSESGDYPAFSVPLSDQEYRYLSYAVQKFSNRKIAEKEGLSEVTIRKHYAKLYKKLNVFNRRELVEQILYQVHLTDISEKI